jgi:antitoxin component YwqK of YwqJK toxin-antitoxin module
MKNTLLISFLLFNILSFSQKTKSYYINIDGDEVFKKTATFKRIVTQKDEIYKVEDQFLNGNIYQTGFYTDKTLKTKTDTFLTYYINGNLSNETVYKNNRRNGISKDYLVSGQLEKQSFHINGEKAGNWYWFNNNGDTIKHIKDAVSYKIYAYDSSPYPEGGYKRLNAFLKEMTDPRLSKDDMVQARLFYTYKVNSSGEISDVEIIVHGTPDMDSTLIQHLRKMPNWKPGRKQGKKVNKTILRYFTWSLILEKEDRIEDKKLAKALYVSAVNSFKRNKIEDAKDKFELALKYNPNNAEYYFNFALCYYQLGDIDTACEYWNIVNILNPEKITKDIQSVCKNKL